jgi:hypothetical protein
MTPKLDLDALEKLAREAVQLTDALIKELDK